MSRDPANALRIFINNGEIFDKEKKGDFFVILTYSNTQKLSSVEPNTLNPVWDQEIVFRIGAGIKKLDVSLYSQDHNNSDTLVGSSVIEDVDSYVDRIKKTVDIVNPQNQLEGRINLEICAGGGPFVAAQPARTGKLIHIVVERAKIIRKWDETQIGDPFAVVTYNDYQATTKIKVNRKRVVWKEHFVFKALDGGGKMVEIAVWDKDLKSGDECIGTSYLADGDITPAKSRGRLPLMNEGRVDGHVIVEAWLEYAQEDEAEKTAAPPSTPMKTREAVFPPASTATSSAPSEPAPKDGYGVLAYPDAKSRYEGNIVGGLPHGQGTCTYANGAKYQGNFVQGNAEGEGVCEYVGGVVYRGSWHKDRKEGKGTQTWPSGHRYEGEWVNGKQEGRGVYTFPSGSVYDGEWVANKQQGKGTYRWVNGQKYEGDWVDDMKEGQGVVTYATGETYSGSWKRDHQEGEGVRTWPDGLKYVGQNRNDLREGKGVQTDKEGKVIHDGMWKAGKPV